MAIYKGLEHPAYAIDFPGNKITEEGGDRHQERNEGEYTVDTEACDKKVGWMLLSEQL